MQSINMDALIDTKCDVITNAAQMAGLEREWNELWLKAKGSVYQSYSLAFHSWNEIALPAGRSLFCIVVRDKGKMVLVFPLIKFRKGPFWIVRPLGPNTAEITDILADPDANYRENAKVAWRAVETESKADVIHMPYVKVGSMLEQLIQQRRHLRYDTDVAPFANLQDQANWDEYAKLAGANSRLQLNRKRNRLSEMGDLQFVEVNPTTDRGSAMELMDWMFAQKKLWSERVGRQGPWLTSDCYRNFIYRWITDPNNVSQTIVNAILIDGMPVAVTLAPQCVTHVDMIIAGFHADPRYAKYSPGIVLDEFLMKTALARRLNVDFGVGDEPYKLVWSRKIKTDLASYHIPNSLMGSTVTQLWRLRRKAIARLSERRNQQAEPATAA